MNTEIETLLACRRSGQITDAQWEQHCRENSELRQPIADVQAEGSYPAMPDLEETRLWTTIFKWSKSDFGDAALAAAEEVEAIIHEKMRAFADATVAHRQQQAAATPPVKREVHPSQAHWPNDHASVVREALIFHGKKWPKELDSGNMFFMGERITRAEFVQAAAKGGE
jgi:hypothetical protein